MLIGELCVIYVISMLRIEIFFSTRTSSIKMGGQENEFINVFCKMAAILSQPMCECR